MRRGAPNEEVGIGKTVRFQTSGNGLNHGRSGSSRIAGPNFYELFVNVAGELLVGCQRYWIGGQTRQR